MAHSNPLPSRAERIVACLTPPGRGAIAVLAVEGPGAVAEVSALFAPASGRPLEMYGPPRVVFGRFGPEPGEEVIVRLRSPDALEIHCHGGQWAIARIQSLLAGRGWRPVGGQEWLARNQPDPIVRQAAEALAHAPTRRTAAILLDQFQGALHRAIHQIDTALAEGQWEIARSQLRRLIALVPLGLHLTTPWRVVLAGPPNAGKSSLLNALAGFPRAIIHPQAGTTRDVVTLSTAIEGWPVLLCDTAGLRATDHPLEGAGVRKAHNEVARADLVVAVFDATRPRQAQEPLIQQLPDPVIVLNKVDLASNRQRLPLGLYTSAVTSEGVEELLRAIAHRLVPQPPEPGQAVPFTPTQASLLRSALEAIAHQDAPGARRQLASIVRGEDGADPA